MKTRVPIYQMKTKLVKKPTRHKTLVQIKNIKQIAQSVLFSEVPFKITSPSPLISAVAVFPMYNFSSPTTSLNVGVYLGKHGV
ncbi:hypothetical protein HanLR1_Chr13g0476881 [Helianthus annuus]|nr:hypothetical protein HanLR1_Chr13g0476881 [Helianthus annuus]